jgi:hypothetical protein
MHMCVGITLFPAHSVRLCLTRSRMWALGLGKQLRACLTDSFALMHGCCSNNYALVCNYRKNRCTHVRTCLGESHALLESLRVCDF